MTDSVTPIPACSQEQPAADAPDTSVQAVRCQAWLRDNRAAIESWNDYTERAGLPLGHLRQF